MSRVNDPLNPLFEGLTDQGVDYVGKVRPGKCLPLPLQHWQCLHHGWVACSELQEAFNLQAFKEWDTDVFDIDLLDS